MFRVEASRKSKIALAASLTVLGASVAVVVRSRDLESNRRSCDGVTPGTDRSPPGNAWATPTRDCGAAALYVIARSAHQPTSLGELRKLTRTTAIGTNFLDLKEAALQLGYEVDGCRLSFRELCRHLDKPNSYAILHLDVGHFVPALANAGHERIRIADANFGVQDVCESDLNALGWSGAALLILIDDRG